MPGDCRLLLLSRTQFNPSTGTMGLQKYTPLYVINGELCHHCFIIISESTQHDVIAVHLFQKNLIEYLTEKSEGTCKDQKKKSTSQMVVQYKNCKNFLNLCWHLVDFGMPAVWHFFATKASLHHAYKDVILTVPVCC